MTLQELSSLLSHPHPTTRLAALEALALTSRRGDEAWTQAIFFWVGLLVYGDELYLSRWGRFLSFVFGWFFDCLVFGRILFCMGVGGDGVKMLFIHNLINFGPVLKGKR